MPHWQPCCQAGWATVSVPLWVAHFAARFGAWKVDSANFVHTAFQDVGQYTSVCGLPLADSQVSSSRWRTGLRLGTKRSLSSRSSRGSWARYKAPTDTRNQLRVSSAAPKITHRSVS